MNARDATRFEHGKSEAHATILALAAQDRGCTCEAYKDWLTYKRWQALGMQVQRGEHGIKLTTYQQTEETDPKTNKTRTRTRPWRYSVFCRCQVAPKDGKPDA